MKYRLRPVDAPKQVYRNDVYLHPNGNVSQIKDKFGKLCENKIRPDKVIVECHTGKSDRGGKEIYEGDILELEIPIKDASTKFIEVIVEYRTEWLGYSGRSGKDYYKIDHTMCRIIRSDNETS